ncbi:hypothetical protein N7530_011199 [Penicillium desertorum]|uniref:Uncharacterized protein n=1 Tax=Penicillium desertorum TaxID=1303715 RepID=A0A9W9WH86_9EURO|nr:hypothetical protein N7530_011199 [Penicillium desertorum]
MSSTERTKEQLARVTLCHANPKIQMMFRTIGCKHKCAKVMSPLFASEIPGFRHERQAQAHQIAINIPTVADLGPN